MGSHMRTHSWGSPAHLQFLGFASAPSLAVDTLVTLPDEEHPSVPGVDAVCSLGAGTLGRRSHRVSSHPPIPTVGAGWDTSEGHCAGLAFSTSILSLSTVMPSKPTQPLGVTPGEQRSQDVGSGRRGVEL